MLDIKQEAAQLRLELDKARRKLDGRPWGMLRFEEERREALLKEAACHLDIAECCTSANRAREAIAECRWKLGKLKDSPPS